MIGHRISPVFLISGMIYLVAKYIPIKFDRSSHDRRPAGQIVGLLFAEMNDETKDRTETYGWNQRVERREN